jgi:hypothetical protein
MSDNKRRPSPRSKSKDVSIVRSSAAEYLTFIAATGGGSTSVEMRYEDENLWLTQKMMATLYDVSVPAISQNLKRVFDDNELVETAVVKQYLTTAADGKNYQVKHYSLQAIIAVGFKIENERAVQFRKWANQVVKDYTIQGWVMDPERLFGGADAAHRLRLPGHGGTAGHAPHAHDHAGLGRASERLLETLGPRHLERRGQGLCRAGQGPRRNRVREIPHRARPLV